MKPVLKIVLILVLGMSLSFCDEPTPEHDTSSLDQLMSDYITKNSEHFSEFGKLMRATELNSLLGLRGPYTLLLPDDDAMLAYYQYKGVQSLEDFSPAFQRELLLYHLIGISVSTDIMGLGRIPYPNAVGDNLSSDVVEGEIFISKHSKIIKRNIPMSNGLVHFVDRVIDPITSSVYQLVANNPSFTVFSEGLRLSGLEDTLNIISFSSGVATVRNNFTVLAVSDSIYRKHGINSVEDLISWCGSDGDSLTHFSNPFYQYMDYHCLTGAHFLSDLNTDVYPVLSRENSINMTIDTDYKIDLDSQTKSYTGFVIPNSNTAAKNGVLHAIDGILPAREAKPFEVLFETTDFVDLKNGSYYGNNNKRWFYGETNFKKIHWKGDYLLYFYDDSWNSPSFLNNDCLSMSGMWSISITFPKVMKGNYDIYLFNWSGERFSFAATIDGAATTNFSKNDENWNVPKIAGVSFDTTSEHTITLKNTTGGKLYWDYVKFVPVE